MSLLAEIDRKIVGAILYTKCRVETNNGDVEVLTFGPLCVDPDFQKKGIGAKILLESIKRAKELDYKAILICGVPTYYPKFGFKTADMFGITMPDGSNFDAFMGYELQSNALAEVRGKFYEPDSLDCDIHNEAYMSAVEEFDKGFPYMEKLILPTQWR
jgi:predicted N-acetyltransferase YhbS